MSYSRPPAAIVMASERTRGPDERKSMKTEREESEGEAWRLLGCNAPKQPTEITQREAMLRKSVS
ncbi:hypothetical protein WN55_06633 [Dufourea novaeangliae]|uniref:Uncharacterized protein n=1 Tax=Dufourea novaeangliae TaxID=178035 RepID=A0A154PQN3_DUFNO|nr:hypothetical protein WN55_06633 [Dufourea novaeangliae]